METHIFQFYNLRSETEETQMRKKTMQINKKQLNHLASYMENHPQFARGALQAKNGKLKMNQMWQNLANTLNSFGPPAKTVKEWQRVRFIIIDRRRYE